MRSMHASHWDGGAVGGGEGGRLPVATAIHDSKAGVQSCIGSVSSMRASPRRTVTATFSPDLCALTA